MIKTNRKKAVRYLILALTLVVACSICSFTAFAAGTGNSGKTTASSSDSSSKSSNTIESQPDVVSENWSLVLSGIDSSSAGSAAVSSSASSKASTDSGVSWILVVGIILVALGLGGIGFFVYIQFINKGDTLVDITAQAKHDAKKHARSSAPRPRRK